MSMHTVIAIQEHREKLVLQHLHRYCHNVKREKKTQGNAAILVLLDQT